VAVVVPLSSVVAVLGGHEVQVEEISLMMEIESHVMVFVPVIKVLDLLVDVPVIKVLDLLVVERVSMEMAKRESKEMIIKLIDDFIVVVVGC
jgi:hypothetical protein